LQAGLLNCSFRPFSYIYIICLRVTYQYM
jgi:hypothetical protein